MAGLSGDAGQLVQVLGLPGGHVNLHTRRVIPGAVVATPVVELGQADDELVVVVLAELVELGVLGGVAAVEELAEGPAVPAVQPIGVLFVHNAQVAVAQVHPAVLVRSQPRRIGQHDVPVGRIIDLLAAMVHNTVVEVIAHSAPAPQQHVIGDVVGHGAGGDGLHVEAHVNADGVVVGNRSIRVPDQRALSADDGDVQIHHRQVHHEGLHIVPGCGGLLRVIPEVHAGARLNGVPGVGGVAQVVDDEAVLSAVLQLQARRGERDPDTALAAGLYRDLRVIDSPVCPCIVRPVFEVNVFFPFGLNVVLVKHDAVVQVLCQTVPRLCPGGRSARLGLAVQLQEAYAAVLAQVQDVLADVQVDVGIHPGVGAVGGTGEGLGEYGRLVVQGVNGHMQDADGIVAVSSRVVFCHIVEVVNALRLQAADVDRALYAFPGGDTTGLAVRANVHTGDDLQNSVLTVQRSRFIAGTGLRLGIHGTRGNRHPVDGTILAELEFEAYAGGLGLYLRGARDKLRRGLIVGGKLQAGDFGLVDAVGIDEPQIEDIGRRLVQDHVINPEGVLFILLHIPHTEAQRTGNGVGLQFVFGGRGGALGQQSIVELAVLVGHNDNHAVSTGNLGHIGIPRAESRYGIIRRREGNHLYGAALIPGIHQHGGQIVGAAGGQAGNLGSGFLVALGDLEGTVLHGDVAVGGRLDQVFLTDRAVGDGADSPVNGTGLIGGEHGVQAGGDNIPRLGIARQNAGHLGGLLRRYGVHLLAGDDGGDAGPDFDLVGQHFHLTAGGVDHQMFDVALTGDDGGRVKVQFLDHRAAVNNNVGFRGGLVHRQLGHGAPAHLDGGLRRTVDHLFHAAGQLQQNRLPVVGLLALGIGLALQGNVLQAQAVGGVVLDVGAGAHGGAADLRHAVGLKGYQIAPEIVHQQLVSGNIAQQDAGPAAFALAGAAGDDAAQDCDVLQLDAAQTHAAGDIQVAADDGIPQGHVRRSDGHVAEHAAQGVVAGLLEGRADQGGDHGGHLAPGHVALGTEGAVFIAADQVMFQGGLDGTPGPVADLAGIGKVQQLSRGFLKHHVPPQDGGRRLTGQGIPGGGGGGRGAMDVLGGVGNAHVVIKPVVFRYVLKGRLTGFMVAVGAVGDGHEVRTGQGPVGVVCLVGADEAPLHQLAEVGVRPVGRGRALQIGQAGDKAQDHHQGQQKGRCPPFPEAAGGMGNLLHRSCSFQCGQKDAAASLRKLRKTFYHLRRRTAAAFPL